MKASTLALFFLLGCSGGWQGEDPGPTPEPGDAGSEETPSICEGTTPTQDIVGSCCAGPEDCPNPENLDNNHVSACGGKYFCNLDKNVCDLYYPDGYPAQSDDKPGDCSALVCPADGNPGKWQFDITDIDDDLNVCTFDQCVEGEGTMHTPTGDGQVCLLPDNSSGHCQAGVCVP